MMQASNLHSCYCYCAEACTNKPTLLSASISLTGFRKGHGSQISQGYGSQIWPHSLGYDRC